MRLPYIYQAAALGLFRLKVFGRSLHDLRQYLFHILLLRLSAKIITDTDMCILKIKFTYNMPHFITLFIICGSACPSFPKIGKGCF